MTTQPPEDAVPSDNPVSESVSTAASAAAEAAEETSPDEPSFGWNDYAERLNGRFAMLGFAAILITQLFTRQDFWSWIGL